MNDEVECSRVHMDVVRLIALRTESCGALHKLISSHSASRIDYSVHTFQTRVKKHQHIESIQPTSCIAWYWQNVANLDSIFRRERMDTNAAASSSKTVMLSQDDVWPNDLIDLMLSKTGLHESGEGYRMAKELLVSSNNDVDVISDDGDDDDEGVESKKSDDGELQQLLEFRKEVNDLLISNEQYSDTLKLAISQVRLAIGETEKLTEYLDHADSLSDHLSRGDSIPLHSEKIKLPLFPDIYQEIPRIAYQAKEVEDLRISLSTFDWSEKDVKRLKEIVLKQCKKIAAIRMADDGKKEDVFETILQMTDEDLLQHSMPSSDKDTLDWTLIARELGEAHTPESCRTRWLMKERPGLNKKDWTEDELVKLQKSIQMHRDNGHGSNWESISREIGNGRLAIDCFCASQKNDLINEDDKVSVQEESLTAEEEKQIKTLFEALGARPALIQQHLPTSRKRSTIGKHIERLQSERQKEPDTWLIGSEVELVRYLARSVKSTRQVILRDPWRVKEIDWDGYFPLRPRGVSSDDVQHRWERIVRDSKVHPQKYFDLSKRTAKEEEIQSSSKKPRGRPPKKF